MLEDSQGPRSARCLVADLMKRMSDSRRIWTRLRISTDQSTCA